MHSFWGDLFLSLSIAACLTLAFESPMLTIEKVIFGFGKSTLSATNKKNVFPNTNRLIGEAPQNNSLLSFDIL